MRLAERELRRICSEINAEGLAVVTVYWTRAFGEDVKDAEGYVQYTFRPQRIFIRKKAGYSYKDMILTLFHEYGHVLDEKRYKGCRRLKLCHKYRFDDGDYETAQGYSPHIKRAFLHMEYIAEKYIWKLMKRYGLADVLFTKREVDRCNMHTIMIKKYQFVHGKYPARRVRQLWHKQLNERAKFLTMDYVHDVERV